MTKRGNSVIPDVSQNLLTVEQCISHKNPPSKQMKTHRIVRYNSFLKKSKKPISAEGFSCFIHDEYKTIFTDS